MFEQAIEADAQKQLALLVETGLIDDAYLAGGTALALQLGHRISCDLDFFTATEFDRNEVLQKLAKVNFKLEQESWGTVLGRLGKTKFSLFIYQYPLICKTLKYRNVAIASLEDLAAMKISAISSRGTKRDFTDLYYLKDEFTLQEMIGFYDKKFKNLDTNKAHLLKSLCYFNDADSDPEPNMLTDDYFWEQIKQFFNQEVQGLAKQLTQENK